jgi:hypothetical protein
MERFMRVMEELGEIYASNRSWLFAQEKELDMRLKYDTDRTRLLSEMEEEYEKRKQQVESWRQKEIRKIEETYVSSMENLLLIKDKLIDSKMIQSECELIYLDACELKERLSKHDSDKDERTLELFLGSDLVMNMGSLKLDKKRTKTYNVPILHVNDLIEDDMEWDRGALDLVWKDELKEFPRRQYGQLGEHDHRLKLEFPTVYNFLRVYQKLEKSAGHLVDPHPVLYVFQRKSGKNKPILYLIYNNHKYKEKEFRDYLKQNHKS